MKRPDSQTRSNRLRNPRPIRVPRPSERNPACRAASRERCGSSNRTSCDPERDVSGNTSCSKVAPSSAAHHPTTLPSMSVKSSNLSPESDVQPRPAFFVFVSIRFRVQQDGSGWATCDGVDCWVQRVGVNCCQPHRSLVRRNHRRFGDVLTRRPGRCKGVAMTGEGLRQLLLRIMCLVRPGPEICVGMGDDPVAVEAWLGAAAASETYARRANGSMAIFV